MGKINPISRYFYEKELLSQRYRKEHDGPLKEVTSILLLVSEEDREETKALQLLAYERFPNISLNQAVVCTSDKEPSSSAPDVFILGKNDFNWKKSLRNPHAHGWLEESFDLLINFDVTDDIRMHYISAVAHARLKVGHCPNPWKIYDLLLEGENISCEARWGRLSELLKNINKNI